MKERRRRLNLSIKREMQRRLILKILAIVLFSLLCSTLLFYIYSSQEVGRTYYQAHIKIRSFLQLLWPVVLGGLIIGAVVGLLVALFYPHPIAGPLYRIEKELKEVGKGNLTLHLRLRKGDELKELAEVINSMVADLNARMRQVKELFSTLQEAIEKDQVDDARKALRELKGILDSFRT